VPDELPVHVPIPDAWEDGGMTFKCAGCGRVYPDQDEIQARIKAKPGADGWYTRTDLYCSLDCINETANKRARASEVLQIAAEQGQLPTLAEAFKVLDARGLAPVSLEESPQ
jgi:hypothetical protein